MSLVLIVDDYSHHRALYRTILEFAGQTVREAANGAEALYRVREGRPDLIVMDVAMPVLDGLEATRRLKGDPSTRDIPILVLTAHADPSDREDAEQAGANAYLAKSCQPTAVLAEVERLLRCPRGEAGASPTPPARLRDARAVSHNPLSRLHFARLG